MGLGKEGQLDLELPLLAVKVLTTVLSKSHEPEVGGLWRGVVFGLGVLGLVPEA